MATNNAINLKTPVVYFFAQPSADILNVSGDATVYDCVFDQQIYDYSNNYDPVTGIFTAPYTASYFFCGIIYCQTINTKTQLEIYLATTAATYKMVDINPVTTSSGDKLSLPFSACVPMTATDTAKLQFVVTGGAKDTDILVLGGTFTSIFQGYMISEGY